MTSARVALVQRLVPHYNLEFYKKLLANSRHRWEFLYGPHREGGESGLASNAEEILPTRRIINQRIGGAVWQRGAVGWIQKEKYDAVIIEVGWQIISNPWLMFRAHQAGAVVIPWAKGISESGRPRPTWRRLLERVFVHRCDALLAYGKVSEEYFADYGYPRERIFVAQNTLDVRAIAVGSPQDARQAVVLRQKLGLPAGPVFGYFGRLVAQKRIDILIDAFVQAQSAGLGGSLVITGAGPEREGLEARARATTAAAKIFFTGRIPEGEAGAYFQLFDVYLSAFSAGLGILEAMAHGKLVLMAPENRPETEFVVDGRTGIITAGLGVDDMAAGLHRAAAAVRNGNRQGLAGRQAVLDGATQERMVEVFDDAVDFALKRKKR